MNTTTTKPAPTRKAKARAIFSRRVTRQTFLARVVELNVTLGTAKVWWQQFKVAKTTKPAKAAAKSKAAKVARSNEPEPVA